MLKRIIVLIVFAMALLASGVAGRYSVPECPVCPELAPIVPEPVLPVEAPTAEPVEAV